MRDRNGSIGGNAGERWTKMMKREMERYREQ